VKTINGITDMHNYAVASFTVFPSKYNFAFLNKKLLQNKTLANKSQAVI